jgi:hypothetical protein
MLDDGSFPDQAVEAASTRCLRGRLSHQFKVRIGHFRTKQVMRRLSAQTMTIHSIPTLTIENPRRRASNL